MEFLYHTEVIWNYPIPDDTVQAIRQMISSLVSQGKTDGLFTRQDEEYVRQWVDLAAAEEWRDYVNTLTPSPISVSIIPNV